MRLPAQQPARRRSTCPRMTSGSLVASASQTIEAGWVGAMLLKRITPPGPRGALRTCIANDLVLTTTAASPSTWSDSSPIPKPSTMLDIAADRKLSTALAAAMEALVSGVLSTVCETGGRSIETAEKMLLIVAAKLATAFGPAMLLNDETIDRTESIAALSSSSGAAVTLARLSPSWLISYSVVTDAATASSVLTRTVRTPVATSFVTLSWLAGLDSELAIPVTISPTREGSAPLSIRDCGELKSSAESWYSTTVTSVVARALPRATGEGRVKAPRGGTRHIQNNDGERRGGSSAAVAELLRHRPGAAVGIGCEHEEGVGEVGGSAARRERSAQAWSEGRLVKGHL